MSSIPAAPQSAAPEEQQFSPEGSAAKHRSTAVLSAALFSNAAASAPEMREQHTKHDAITARDREIRIPRARSSPGRSLLGRTRIISWDILDTNQTSVNPANDIARDARPNRSTPDFSRWCEVDAGKWIVSSETVASLRAQQSCYIYGNLNLCSFPKDGRNWSKLWIRLPVDKGSECASVSADCVLV